MSAIPSIYISNVLVAEVEKNSMLFSISILSEKNKERTVKMKALLDTGAGGKFIDPNFILALGHTNWKSPSQFTTWMEPKTKLERLPDMQM